MKIRHAAALALVGWYLMVTPPISITTMQADTQAVLSEWSISRSFDSADACEKAKSDFQKTSPKLVNNGVGISRFASCISTDDPRLKGKIGSREKQARFGFTTPGGTSLKRAIGSQGGMKPTISL